VSKSIIRKYHMSVDVRYVLDKDTPFMSQVGA